MVTDTSHFKIKLEEEKVILEEELSSLGSRNPEVRGDWQTKPDSLNTDTAEDSELADAQEDFEERNAIQNKLENRLIDVTAALTKIAEGRYGICEVSGEPIEGERLEVNPAARTCIAHKETL